MSSTCRLIFGASAFATIFALVACGAPPDSQGQTQQESTAAAKTGTPPATDGQKVDVGTVATTNSGTADADASAPELACNTLKKDTCVTCCNVAYPQLSLGFKQTLAQCVCNDPGECRTECGTNFCSGKAATPACATCISNSTVCGPATLTVCKATAACSAYLTCLDGCK